jgi:pRiA4b ORF-3-like protein
VSRGVKEGCPAPRSLLTVKTRRLRVRLLDVIPEVQRVIDVPPTVTLAELHDLLQAAVGWTNRHLHEFHVGAAQYGVPDPDQPWLIDESTVRLPDLPTPFSYLYDLGDGWDHEIALIGPGGNEPGCGSGTGACPPEDCGGPPGYAHLLEALSDPGHPEHEELTQWAGGLVSFDQPATDLLVRQTVGAVPESVRLVLDLAEGGVKLTPGGRLPRAFVRQVQEQRPLWHSLPGRPAAVEDDLQPLAVLHDVLRHVGLLRLSTGRLWPTRAAADDQQVVRRLRTWFEPGGFERTLVEVTTAVLVVRGPMKCVDLADLVFPLLGTDWARNGRQMTIEDVNDSLAYLAADLRGLELVGPDRDVWQAGTSARSLLPNVNLLSRSLDDL